MRARPLPERFTCVDRHLAADRPTGPARRLTWTASLALAASASAGLGTGCATLFTERLSSTHEVRRAPRCTASTTAAAVDGTFAAVYLLTGAVLAAAGEGEAGTAPLVAGGLHLASGIGGAVATGRCKRARDEHDRFVAALEHRPMGARDVIATPALPGGLEGQRGEGDDPPGAADDGAAADAATTAAAGANAADLPPPPPRITPSNEPWGDFWQPLP